MTRKSCPRSSRIILYWQNRRICLRPHSARRFLYDDHAKQARPISVTVGMAAELALVEAAFGVSGWGARATRQPQEAQLLGGVRVVWLRAWALMRGGMSKDF